MVWSAPIMANNLKNKVTLKVRLFRRLSEVLLRRFVASPVKSVMPSTSSLCKCRIIILNNHKYSSFFYEDAKYSYKQAYGYFPGVVSIDGIIAYIENRDGNCRIFYIRAIHSALSKRTTNVGRESATSTVSTMTSDGSICHVPS